MTNIPLAEKLRPKTISQFVGQKKLVGKNGIIKKLLASYKNKHFPSLIFWGPPGSGKTTLARIISNKLKRDFYDFSAVNTSIKEVEQVIGKASLNKQLNLTKDDKKFSPIIFLDEIHRFNKAQQDKLLPHVENGSIVLIGATTENPSFEVIGPLLSRSRVIILEQLTQRDLKIIGRHTLKEIKKEIDKEALNFLVESSNGDARILINVLEIAGNLSKTRITLNDTEQALQKKQLSFDKFGEEHYNVISAFIKSMRAGQPNAAIYYLARMVEVGQDPLYIARRMVIFASEDVGMAQPTALVVANEVFQACQQIGYPECSINLAHGVIYLATAKKSRSAYEALRSAQGDVRKFGNLPIPKIIRNPVTKLMEREGYGKDYEMYTKKSFLPEKLKRKKYINR